MERRLSRWLSAPCNSRKEREPAVLGTLAAAYAETGSYDRAIETEQKAADLAARQGNAQLAEMLSQRLALFEKKTPIRQK
jgi:hypothetical protein